MKAAIASSSAAAFRMQAAAPWVSPAAGTGAIECATSGSSGSPKVIRRSLASWQASFEVNRALFGFAPGDGIAVLGALSHSLALYGLMEGLHCGLDVHLLHGLRPAAQTARLQEGRASVIYATPTQLRLLSGPPVRSVRLVLCGGGSLDAAARASAAALFPEAALHEFYGASETSFITLADAGTPPGSVGRPYPGVTLEIRNPADGVGEVWVKSPYLFEGYAEGDSPATRRDGAFLTVGELGRLDAQSHLHLAGRRDRMVTIADRNVHPEALERFLAGHLSPRLSAVATRPDPLRGHVLTAYVERGTGPQDEAALRRDIAAELGVSPPGRGPG
ncbi:AMP-binding protein [Mangrovicoccus ximenensis]|uniref:AMP-binding protein n=1 Tax=Mangrovicoccus ximenensis TaxID=1911570 RepID=UPI001F20106B|nr:AMP-binding protein [Mangrovicoccus ximenensis]